MFIVILSENQRNPNPVKDTYYPKSCIQLALHKSLWQCQCGHWTTGY